MNNMGTINFTIDATEIKATPNRSFISVELEMDEADIPNILTKVPVKTVIEHYDIAAILEEMDIQDIIRTIGTDEVIDALDEFLND